MKETERAPCNNPTRAPTDADPAILLSEALGKLLETSSRRCSKDVAEQITPLAHQVEQSIVTQQKGAQQLQVQGKHLETLISNRQLLDNASQTNLLLGRQHYEEHVIQPLRGIRPHPRHRREVRFRRP